MKLIFLGTGTSIGVPAIGCGCAVCVSADPLNKRRRASLYVEAAGLQIIIDTPPDFREQVLAFKVNRLDAVLFTHAHVDHKSYLTHICHEIDHRQTNAELPSGTSLAHDGLAVNL